MTRIIFLRAVLFGLALTAGIEPSFAGIVAHKAVYELKSARTDKQSGLNGVTGLMVYQLEGSVCEGWTTTYRMASRFAKTEGRIQISDTQLTSFESGDGSSMQLSQKQFVDNRLQTETNLFAKKVVGRGGTGQITRPEQKTFKLPEDTIFPILHQSRILEQAASGAQYDRSTLYEGSDSDGAYTVISFISKLFGNGGKAGLKINEKFRPLARLNSWAMSMSYYKSGDKYAELPVYQANFQMFENGVTTTLSFDYGNYILEGELVKLEMLPMGDCS